MSSLSSFSIEHTNSSDRLNINIMLLLTKVAFKQIQNNLTPNISYLTLLDKYVFTGLGFLFIVILQNTLSSSNWYRNYDNFDYYSFIGLGLFFIAYNIMFSLIWLLK